VFGFIVVKSGITVVKKRNPSSHPASTRPPIVNPYRRSDLAGLYPFVPKGFIRPDGGFGCGAGLKLLSLHLHIYVEYKKYNETLVSSGADAYHFHSWTGSHRVFRTSPP
jgi:hypothetical protein